MNPLAIRDAIVGHVADNYTRTPVNWPNRSFNPEQEAPDGHWIRLNILMAGTELAENGLAGLSFRRGTLKLQVFGPKGKEGREAWTTAGTLESLFRREILSDCLIFDEPSTNEIATDDKWYQLVVDVPFTVLTDL